MSILTKLNDKKDKEYKKFQERICHTKYKILGIKIPILRKYANELLKNYNYHDLLSQIKSNSYEEVMLEGIIIGKCQASYEEKLHLITNFLPKIDNWAVCDIFCSELKFVKDNLANFNIFLKVISQNPKEYYQRFYFVMLLNYYVNSEYITDVLNSTLNVKSNYYYVKMAVSWLLSVCLVHDFPKTINFLNKHKNEIDKWTFNKALQKALESLQISPENKEIIKTMKIK